MRVIIFVLCVTLAGGFNLSAQILSGNLDTKITLGLGAGGSPDFFYGAEEYANLRLKIPAGNYASIYGAFNLIAAAGTHAQLLSLAASGIPGVYTTGENYAALMELERLYVQFSFDSAGLSAGLLRIPFGFSTVWGPMDFLNPRNPLEPDARYRGVLGIIASWFPEKLEDTKFSIFAAAPKDPISECGEGSRGGVSWNSHWQRMSAELLYCFESPASYELYDPLTSLLVLKDQYPLGLHRLGLSLKAEIEIGLTAEFLYTINPDAPSGIEGLSASLGADYSFFNGRLYVQAEYLFSGTQSVSARSAGFPSGHTGSHYLYTAGIWKWSDFSLLTLGCAANLEDISFTPLVSWQYEFIQGMVFSVNAYVPLDKSSFNAGARGELGPENSSSYGYLTMALKIKF